MGVAQPGLAIAAASVAVNRAFQHAAVRASSSRAARTASVTSSRRVRSRTAAATWVESVRWVVRSRTSPASFSRARARPPRMTDPAPHRKQRAHPPMGAGAVENRPVSVRPGRVICVFPSAFARLLRAADVGSRRSRETGTRACSAGLSSAHGSSGAAGGRAMGGFRVVDGAAQARRRRMRLHGLPQFQPRRCPAVSRTCARCAPANRAQGCWPMSMARRLAGARLRRSPPTARWSTPGRSRTYRMRARGRWCALWCGRGSGAADLCTSCWRARSDMRT